MTLALKMVAKLIGSKFQTNQSPLNRPRLGTNKFNCDNFKMMSSQFSDQALRINLEPSYTAIRPQKIPPPPLLSFVAG